MYIVAYTEQMFKRRFANYIFCKEETINTNNMIMYYFTNYYDQELKNRQVKSLKNLLQASEKLLKNYSEESQISEIDLSDIEKLTQAGEKIGLLCRASLEEREKQEFDYFDDSYQALCIKDLPVSFSFDGKTVAIKTPLMLKKGSAKVKPGHYHLSEYLKAAAAVWKRNNPEIDLTASPEFEGPLIAVITRRARNYNRTIHCDNDNLEAGRLLNTLCSIIGIGDNCKKLDILTRFRECENDEEEGTEILITSLKNININL